MLRQLAPVGVLLVVVAAIVGVAALRSRANQGRQAEVLLVQLEGLTQEQFAQVGQAVGQGAASPELMAEVRRSRSEFDTTLASLRLVFPAERTLSGLPHDVRDFRRSADATFAMVDVGEPSLAAAALEGEAAPSAHRVLDQLSRTADASGAEARRLDRGGEIGSLLVLLVSGLIVWLLLRQVGRARSRAQWAASQVSNHERFRSLVQNSSDVITVVDGSGTVLYQTPSVKQVFGYDADKLVGQNLQTILHPDDVEAVTAALSRPQGLGSERIECRVRHSDGRYRHVETALSDRLDDPRVRGMILNTRDITERKELEDQLAYQAFHDSLTGLANRALFRDRLEHALARMRRQQRPMAVLLLDIDSFKNVNDSLGHAFGDAFLQAVADRLRGLLRPSDTAARLGGDEFAILLEDLRRAGGATVVADRILEALRVPFLVQDKEVVAAASIGITIAESTSRDADDLLRNADVAMYTAKSRGRNRCELFKPSMHKAMLDRLDLEADLRRAVEREEFVLHYQPTVNLTTGCLSGMEALVRWDSHSRGMVPPGVFIPVAEDTGLIVPLGAWVLEQACRQAVIWDQEFDGHGPQTMSVNLSARQLQDDGLVFDVARILSTTGIDPHRVVLEITESAVMSDAEAMVARLHELKSLGVRLAIDDFGTGYSSMSYLCSFPIDILKIDRSFVHGVRREPQKTGIVRMIVELGRILHLQTIAEGIELNEELEELRALHCDLGQGFWFARPLGVEAASELLSNQAAARRRGEFALLPAAASAS